MKSRRERARDRREQSTAEVTIEGAVLPPIQRPRLSLVTTDPVKMKETSGIQTKRSIPLICLAYGLGLVGIVINGWFAHSRGTTDLDKALMFGLGLITECILFFLPAQAAQLWKGKRYGATVVCWIVCAFLFVFALINSLGFASQNLTDIATTKAERITPAVSDAQRRLDTLSASRATECTKRGDRCRQLEKEEQLALQSLSEARQAVAATSDPQITAAAKLVSWASLNRYTPTADDFAMLRLFLLTMLPQLGGLVLMVARR